MSTYSENYQKLLDGYNKIQYTIDSVEELEQLECVSKMADGWVSLADKWAEQVYLDKSNKNRKKDTTRFIEAGKEMFEDIHGLYQQKIQELQPIEYEDTFKPVRIKGLQEYAE